MFKRLASWQKLQFYLVVMVVLLFIICFFCELCGYVLPESISQFFMGFWSLILLFINPKEINNIISRLYTEEARMDRLEENKLKEL